MRKFKYCVKCGRHIPRNAQICPYCGMKQPQLVFQSQDDYQKANEYTTLPQAIISFFKNYFSIHGTSSRSAFWWWKLCEYLVITILCSLMISFGIKASLVDTIHFIGISCDFAIASGVTLIMFTLATIIPTITLTIRRLRDTGLTKNTIILLLFFDYFVWLIPLFYPISFLAKLLVFIIAMIPTNTFKDSAF